MEATLACLWILLCHSPGDTEEKHGTAQPGHMIVWPCLEQNNFLKQLHIQNINVFGEVTLKTELKREFHSMDCGLLQPKYREGTALMQQCTYLNYL
jgi:hypothetical protein